jgi:tRNA pseudouridine55 synthase
MPQPPRVRVARRPVHGVLLLDKPLGLSSNDALQKAKWLLRAEKAGHTGTLDPLATGVLPLCFGAATKFSQLHLDADKTYAATVQLGVRTSTGDAEGEVLQTRPVNVTQADLERVRQQFMGDIDQVPPMHSALKKNGRALYEYAREGLVLERAARRVRIHELIARFSDNQCKHSAIEIIVKCSKGTYIRTLGEDIGEALGCGGHLTRLRRVQTGPFALPGCITLDQLAELPEGERLARLLPIDALLSSHAPIQLAEAEAARFLSGLRRRGDWADAQQVAVYGAGVDLLGTAHVCAGELIPDRLLNPVEIEQARVQSRVQPFTH